MRHQRAGLHLSRTSSHRRALFSNLIASLFTHERIRTTDAKAKQTRRLAERTITLARRLGDVLTKEPEARTPEERARVVHAVRLARRLVRDRGAVVKLFDEIGPRFLGRPGGYTRIIKVGNRPGDAAPDLHPRADSRRAAAAGPRRRPRAARQGRAERQEAAKEAGGKPEKGCQAGQGPSPRKTGGRGAPPRRGPSRPPGPRPRPSQDARQGQVQARVRQVQEKVGSRLQGRGCGKTTGLSWTLRRRKFQAWEARSRSRSCLLGWSASWRISL